MTPDTHSESGASAPSNWATSLMMAALAAVVTIRLLIQGCIFALRKPMEWLDSQFSSSDTFEFERLQKLKDWLVEEIKARSPGWAEYHRSGMVKLKTTYGAQRLDELVEAIPERMLEVWSRFSIGIMVLFLLGWSIILSALLMLVAKTGLNLAGESLIAAMNTDWWALLQPRKTGSVDLWARVVEFVQMIPEIAVALGTLAVMLLFSVVVMWGLMLFVLPGLVLHEFGHYAAIRKADGSVKHYGLLLYGPILAGAFVEPGDDFEDLATADAFAVWGAGIANSVLWGTTLLSLGFVLSADPVLIFNALWKQEYVVLVQSPVAAGLLAMGAFEVSNGFLNAIPFSEVDGGGFIRTAEEEWWGIGDVKGFTNRVQQLLIPIEVKP